MPKFIKNRKVLAAILALVVVSIVVFQKISSDSTPPKLLTVKHQNLEETLSISGKIAADQDVTLRFQTSGHLTWVGVKTGDYVKKYQTIASLDQREVQDNLQKYLNSYLADRWTLDQTKENYQNTPVSPAFQRIIDQAQFNLNSAVLDVQIKNLAIEYSNLWTPIEGLVVSAESPQAGVNIIPTQAEFEIVNPKSVYFSATADQSDVVNLFASQSAIITLDPYPDQSIASKITSIAFTPKTNETGTVYEIKLALPVDNSDYKYRLGMTGDVNFILRSIPNTIALDTKLINTNPNKTKYVWVYENGKKVKRIVTLGEEFDNQTQITSGLSDGDKVID